MKTIVIHNQKGGVGKTVISGNIAYLMSKNKRVILLDSDPQANLSNWISKSEIKDDLGDVLNGKCSIDKTLISLRKNLDILPLLALGSTYQEFVEVKLQSEVFVFSDLKEELKKLKYDFLIIDTPPQGGLLLESILSIADEVILILNGDMFSIDGLEILNHFLSEVKRKRRANFKSNKIVYNRFNKSIALHNGYLEALNASGYEIYPVGQYQEFSNAITKGSILTEKKKIDSLEKLAEVL